MCSKPNKGQHQMQATRSACGEIIPQETSSSVSSVSTKTQNHEYSHDIVHSSGAWRRQHKNIQATLREAVDILPLKNT